MELRPFKKGQTVFYDVDGPVILAKVRTVHRDGNVTVEPQFYLDSTGALLPGYIGGKVRIEQHHLRNTQFQKGA